MQRVEHETHAADAAPTRFSNNKTKGKETKT
jgi:hypothetical protein